MVSFTDPDPQGNRTIVGPAWHATSGIHDDTPNFERPGGYRPVSSLALEADAGSTSPPTHELTLTRRNPTSQINLFVQVSAERYSHAPLREVVGEMQLRTPVHLESGAWSAEVIQAAAVKAGDCSISGVPAYAVEFHLDDGGDNHPAEVIRAVARARRRVDRGWQDLPVLILADYRASEADLGSTGPAFDRFLDRLVIEGDDFQAVNGSDCREVWSPPRK